MYALEILLKNRGKLDFALTLSSNQLRVRSAILLLKGMEDGNELLADFTAIMSLCCVEAQLCAYVPDIMGKETLNDQTFNLQRRLLKDLLDCKLRNLPLPNYWVEKLKDYNIYVLTGTRLGGAEDRKNCCELLNRRINEVRQGHRRWAGDTVRQAATIIKRAWPDRSRHELDAFLHEFRRKLQLTCYDSANSLDTELGKNYGWSTDEFPSIDPGTS